MIKGNRIIFGYGSLLVCGTGDYESVMIAEVCQPQEVGSQLEFGDIARKEMTMKNNAINFKFYKSKDVMDLLEKLSTLGAMNIDLLEDPSVDKSIEFNGYVLDFNKFNRLSLRNLCRKLIVVLAMLTTKGTDMEEIVTQEEKDERDAEFLDIIKSSTLVNVGLTISSDPRD
jgi:hypothetical protein